MRTAIELLCIPIVLGLAFVAGQFSRQPEIDKLHGQGIADNETINELLDYSHRCDEEIKASQPCAQRAAAVEQLWHRRQQPITEDDPRWDCRTMGNKICGTPKPIIPCDTDLDCETKNGGEY